MQLEPYKMANAVFTTKVAPAYDDLPEERYHFPKTYLRQVEATLSDWIVYYEPRRSTTKLSSRGGRQSYFATARVKSIETDANLPEHFYAYVSDYLEFERPVPFREGDYYFESGLKRSDGATSKGAFGRAVRPISPLEYQNILRAGYIQVLAESNLPLATSATSPLPGFAEEPTIFERPIVERVTARPFRDAAFAAAVKSAYANTCAMTRLKLINGGGRAEVQAAHIRPVASSGTDSVRNGLALSGTVH
jgi:putative restriction endonuclease